jgi:hypothetical protein
MPKMENEMRRFIDGFLDFFDPAWFIGGAATAYMCTAAAVVSAVVYGISLAVA